MQKLTDREKAKQLYIESKGKLPLTEIAEQLGRPASTIRGWKSKDNWDDLTGTLQNETKRSNKTEQTKKGSKRKSKKKENKPEPNIAISSELTDKQQLFCIYYLKYFNATKAYQKAYECDYATANVNGFKMLVNTSIKSEIERLKAERMEDVYLDSKAIMQQYIDIAFADITDYIEIKTIDVPATSSYGELLKDDDGKPIYVKETQITVKNSDEIDGSLINEINSNQSGIKLKLHDKMKALEWLSKNISNYQGGLETDLLKEKIEREKTTIRKMNVEIEKMKSETVHEGEKELDEQITYSAEEEKSIEELYKILFKKTNDAQDGE